MPAATLALLLAAAAPECRASRVPDLPETLDDGFRRVEYRTDVDGDGREDVLRLEGSHGSGGGLASAALSLASGETLEADFSYWYANMVSIIPVPKPLDETRHRGAAALIEEALFGTICTGPDPSLAWLLEPGGGLRWVEGPLVLPESYAFRRRTSAGGEEWVWYGGHNHAYRLGQGPNPPVELARKGQRVLLGTSHGVILTDPGRTRHAWIYVSTPPHKLRWPSVRGARINGDTAVITLSDGDGYLERKGSRTARVNLATGAVSEPPRRELE